MKEKNEQCASLARLVSELGMEIGRIEESIPAVRDSMLSTRPGSEAFNYELDVIVTYEARLKVLREARSIAADRLQNLEWDGEGIS